MANEESDETWDFKLRQDVEQEFFTELALHEAERWIQATTRKKFAYPDDFRKSLENGVLLCELLNNLKPGSVKRINKLPTPLAGLDNINVFLEACKKNFGLKKEHLFDPCDLEDLSQRAISQSEQSLQQEIDRRNTNVAITIYWIGRAVENSNKATQIDQSAFAALVNIHRKDYLSEKQVHHDSLECSGYSSAYSSHDGKEGRGDSVDQKHNRDSSYDSFGSYGHSRESSLTEENMPVGHDMRRYGSTSSLNKNSELRLSSNLDSPSYDGYHQSTPDLSNAHTRTSSVDSYEDSHGNHSRQSSDSVDIPTRTTKTQRRVSQSEDPLKFIKLKPSKDLAKQAEEQIIMSKEVKQVRKVIEREEEDWQSNLSSWKNRRRRVSAAAIERVEGTDDFVKEDEEKKRTKTYEQMRQEREKRKSTGNLHFYPIEDNEDLLWSVKSPTHQEAPSEVMSKVEASQTESKRAPMLSSKYRSKSMGSSTFGVASWADDKDKKEEVPKTNQSKTETTKRTFDENHNAEKSGSARRLSNKLGNIMNRFESMDDANSNNKPAEKPPPRKTFEFKVESKSDRFKDSKVLDTQTARSSLQPAKKAEPAKLRSYVEKTIKIKQKPHNAKGFGITVVGGQDKKQPVVIDKVNIGSAADVCEVMAKDEILTINNRDIGIMTQAMVRKVIEDANKKGELEIRVKRYTSVEEEDGEDGDDDAFAPSTTNNVSKEPETSFSSKSTFEPTRTSSRISESPSTPEKPQRSRPSYQPSPLSRNRETNNLTNDTKPSFEVSVSKMEDSPSLNESRSRSEPPVNNEIRSTYDFSSRGRSESPSTKESSYSRSTLEFSTRSRMEPEKKVESSPPKEETVSATSHQITHSAPKYENPSSRSSASPQNQRRRQYGYYGNTDDNEQSTSIMSELEKEKKWAMEQMSKNIENMNNDNEPDTEQAVEDEIVPQMKTTVETSYSKSYFNTAEKQPQHTEDSRPYFNNTEHQPQQKEDSNSYRSSRERQPPHAEEPHLQQTMPSYENVVEEKPIIRVNRSKPPAHEDAPQVREIPITISTKPEVNHFDLPTSNPPNYQRDRPEDLSPSQSSGGFGPPEILRRWQRPWPRSEYSSNSSINDDYKRLSMASMDSTASSPRFPEEDVTQNHVDAKHPHAVVGQTVTLEIQPEQPARQSFTFHQNSAAPSLVIDPRNRADENDASLPQYNFHLNIGDKANKEKDQVPLDLELERERIRQEEKERVEQERRRWEEEEQRKIMEKEAQLRMEEEKLLQEKQRIEEMKASMEREKMELSMRNSEPSVYTENARFSSEIPSRNNHQFSAYADSNSTPRSLDTSSSWRSSHHREEPNHHENSSREDMLANRTARPFSRRHDNENTKASDNHVDNMSREDIHLVNNAPKPKIRGSQDWMQNSDSGHKHNTRSESPNEHWLVEEAERRRKSGHSSSYQAGPIRPKSDNMGNRWQNDRYGNQPPRSLSPQNTRSNDFKQFSARPQNNLNQTLPANFNMGHIKSKAQPPVPPKPNRTSTGSLSSSTRSSSNLSSPVSPSSPKSHAEQVVAVSGKQLCSHCSQELGFGAAMVIESLGLYYHVQCFKCCVCHTTLGNGAQGADVRVRVNKLHCRNCYSNDEAGLKFSKV